MPYKGDIDKMRYYISACFLTILAHIWVYSTVQANDVFIELTEGVEKLESWAATPGPIEPSVGTGRWSESPWVPIAFCPYYSIGLAEFHPGTLAAARLYHGGRVFAVGHEWYFGHDINRQDNERFGRNVIKWLDRNNGQHICIRRTAWSYEVENNLARKLGTEGYQVSAVGRYEVLATEHLQNCDVLIYSTRWDNISASEIDAVIDFASRGGGILLTGLGWSYIGYVDRNLDEFPMNQIGLRFGIRFEDGYLHNPDQYVNDGSYHPVFTSFYPKEPGQNDPEPGEGPSVIFLKPLDNATNIPIDYKICVKVRDDKQLNPHQMSLTVKEGSADPCVFTANSPQWGAIIANPEGTELEFELDLRFNIGFLDSMDVLPWNTTVDISFQVVDSDGNERTANSRFQTEAISESYTVSEPHPFDAAAILANDITQCCPVATTYLLCYWDDVACTDDGPFEELVQGGDGSGPNIGDIRELRNLVDTQMGYVPGDSASYWSPWSGNGIGPAIRGVFSTRYPGIELPRLFPDVRKGMFITWSDIIRIEMKAGRPFLYGFDSAPHTGVPHCVIVYGWVKGTATQWFLIADSAGWGRPPYYIPYNGPTILEDTLIFAVPDLVIPAQTLATVASGGTVSAQVGGRYEKHEIIVPPGALTQDTVLYVGPPSSNISSLTGAIAEFAPDGTLFSSPATITLQFLEEDVAVGHKGEDIRLYRWNGSLWDIIPDSVADPVNMTVSAPVNHLSTYSAAVPRDMDGDGLNEMNEHIAGTNPMDPDSDWDGLSDYTELAYDSDPMSCNPYNPENNPTGTDLDPLRADTDADGVKDARELTDGTNPLDPGDYIPLADVNGDRKVNLLDFIALATSWLTGRGDTDFNSSCDISSPSDSIVDARDLAVMAGYWLCDTSAHLPIPKAAR